MKEKGKKSVSTARSWFHLEARKNTTSPQIKCFTVPDIRSPAGRVVHHPGVVARGEASRVHAMTCLVLEVVRLELVCQDQLL